MSRFVIEDLLRTAAGDGGSVPFRTNLPVMDSMELFDAWSLEREQTIECEMLLGLSKATLVRLLENEKNPSARGRRSAMALIRQIDHRLKKRSTNRT